MPAGAIAGPRGGLFLGLFAAIDPQAVGLANKILTDFPFSVMVFAGLIMAARLVDRPSLSLAVLLGALLGLAAWLRPQGIALPLALGVGLLAAGLKRHSRSLALAGATVAFVGMAVTGMWAVRNGVVGGNYILSSVTRYNYVRNFGSHTLENAEGLQDEVACDRLCANGP